MPFTFAHPAAILPFLRLRRERGWKETLFAGSIAPDLLRPVIGLDREITHSLAGGLFLDIPCAVLLGLLLHRICILRRPCIEGSGDGGTTHFDVAASFLAAAIGCATHLVWDLFTHEGSPLIPSEFTQVVFFPTRAGPFTLANAMWPLQSAIGLLILLAWATSHSRRSGRWMRPLSAGARVRIAVCTAIPALLLLHGFHPATGNPCKEFLLHLFYHSGKTNMQVLLLSTAAFCAAYLLETMGRARSTFRNGRRSCVSPPSRNRE